MLFRSGPAYYIQHGLQKRWLGMVMAFLLLVTFGFAYGASPRGSIALDRCARAHAWLAGRDFVSPEDIQAVLFDVLRHRIILSFEAEAAGIDQDRVVQRILDVVAVA